MIRILSGSPYIPEQWIAAHGSIPSLLRPSGARIHRSVARLEGLCPYTRAWVSDALDDKTSDGIVMAFTCDQMRRAFEIVRAHARIPCFLFNIPATWRTTGARRLYADELRRLGRFLVRLGGEAPSSEKLADRLLAAVPAANHPHDSSAAGKTPLALTGSHGREDDALWLEMIARANGRIAIDCTVPDPPLFDRRAIRDDPFAALTDASFDAIHDVFQRPNSGFYRKIDRDLGESPARGLIIRRYQWCDGWRAEVYRLKQWSPVPVLDLEIGERVDDDSHRMAMRIESFMEMVQ